MIKDPSIITKATTSDGFVQPITTTKNMKELKKLEKEKIALENEKYKLIKVN